MKTRRTLSGVLLILGLLLAVGTVILAFWARTAQPVLLHVPEDAAARAEAMMAAACGGDYQAASQMLYGTPSLGDKPQDAGPEVELIWEAFLESLSYSFPGGCYIMDDAVALDVTIRYLDVNAVLEGLDARTERLLDQQVQAAQDSSQLYDKDNNFRQELISEVLTTAVSQALEEKQTYREQTVPLRLVFAQEQWWVMPDSALLEILSGAVSQ